MNIRQLCSELAKREKTKSQAKIQAIRSIVGHLSDIIHHGEGSYTGKLFLQLMQNGKRRAKKGKK